MTLGQAFLWLLSQADDQEAGEMVRCMLADPNARWSEIVEKNLADHLKKPGE